MSLVAPNRKPGRKRLAEIAKTTGLFEDVYDHMPPDLEGHSPLFAVESAGNTSTTAENTALNRYRCVLFVRRIDFAATEDALDDLAHALRVELLKQSGSTDDWHFLTIDEQASETGSVVTDETHGVQYRTEDIFIDATIIC